MNPSTDFIQPARETDRSGLLRTIGLKCRTTGFVHDGRKIPLAVFLHVNDLTDFQRQTIARFMDIESDADDISATILMISKHVDMLKAARWSPKRVEGDAVVQPDHYARFPIEPTFFNMENRIDWCLGNALKYICRFPYKNGVEDLNKAKRYLAMWIRFHDGNAGWSK